ncbi:hypothetical protein D9M68_423690 [compost metagenome]
MLGKLFDRVAAVEQHAFVAVDIGDLGFARRRRREARVVGEHLRLLVKRADVHNVRADSPRSESQFRVLAVDGDKRAFVVHHFFPSWRGSA